MQTQAHTPPTRLFPLFVVLLLVVLLAACAPAAQEFRVGADAPGFTLTASDGTEVSLADYAGQPVLLYFHMAVG